MLGSVNRLYNVFVITLCMRLILFYCPKHSLKNYRFDLCSLMIQSKFLKNM